MRGDSLRDLYAKTLALLGLAVLAGVGALVDYWPAGLTLPAVQAPVLLPEPADRTAIAREPLDVIPLSESTLGLRPERVATARRAPVPMLAQPSSSPQTQAPATSLAGELGPEATMVLADSELSSASSPAGIVMTMPGPPLTIDQVPVEEVELPVPMRASAAAVSGGHDDDWLITGAFKKTGSSIVKTGARTGASIFDAMRAVSGMVRRALPTD